MPKRKRPEGRLLSRTDPSVPEMTIFSLPRRLCHVSLNPRTTFFKISFAHAQATGRRENAGAVWLIRACHEAIWACLGSVSRRIRNSPRNKKKASPRESAITRPSSRDFPSSCQLILEQAKSNRPKGRKARQPTTGEATPPRIPAKAKRSSSAS